MFGEYDVNRDRSQKCPLAQLASHQNHAEVSVQCPEIMRLSLVSKILIGTILKKVNLRFSYSVLNN